MLKLISKIFFLAIFCLIAFLVYNTIAFTSQQIDAEKIAIEALPDSAVFRLSQALSIPTVSRRDTMDTLAFNNFRQFLFEKYPKVNTQLEKTTINGYGLIYKWEGRDANLKPVLFMAHQDVVPADPSTLNRWAAGPFSGSIYKECVYGRGALDDKSSLLGMMESAEKLLAKGYSPMRTIYFAFGQDEEIGGAKGGKAIAEYFTKLRIQFEFIIDEGTIVTQGFVPGVSRPIAMIGVAEKGYFTVHLKSTAAGGHSSMPQREATAIGQLAQALFSIESAPMPASLSGVTGQYLDHVGPEMPFLYRIPMANRTFFGRSLEHYLEKRPEGNALLRTTAAMTMIDGGLKENVLPTHAEATINFRIMPGQSTSDVWSYLQSKLDTQKVRPVKGKLVIEPSKVSSTDALGYTLTAKSIKQLIPDAITAPSVVPIATDSRHFQKLTDNIYRFAPLTLTPDDLKRIHGINERISIENYRLLIAFYTQMLQNAGG